MFFVLLQNPTVLYIIISEYLFLPFCPTHKKLAREKLPNSILGLAVSRLLKWCELLLLN